jgi:hypothetical protein
MQSDAPNTSQVLLGLFVVGQLFFLLAANGIDLAESARPSLREEPPEELRDTLEGEARHGSRAALDWLAPGWTRGEGHVNDAENVLNMVLTRWSQIIGQQQDWSLFAPGINTVTSFVAVELRWDDDQVPARQLPPRVALLTASNPLQAVVLAEALRREQANRPPPLRLLSENEPQNSQSFFRVGQFRLRRYESNLDLTLSSHDDQVDDRRVDGWRRQIEDKVRGDWPSLLAYLRWRLAAFRRSQPDVQPPQQVILLVRVYRIPPPDEPPPPGFWPRPDQRPLARWLPDLPEPPGYLPLEMYNPVVGRYERLKTKN